MSPDRDRGIGAGAVRIAIETSRQFNPEDAHRARLLNTMGLLLSAAGLLFLSIQVIFWVHPAFRPAPGTDLLLDGAVILSGSLTLWLVRSGWPRSAAWIVLGVLTVGAAFHLDEEGRPTTNGGAQVSLLLTVALAFVLLERRAAWWVLAAAVIVLTSVHGLWWGGYLPQPIPRDRLSELLFSITAWTIPATGLAAVLYSTMSVLRDQARTLRERVKELTLLHETGNTITRVLDLDTLLETAVESLHHRFGYHSVAILTLNRDLGVLQPKALAGRLARIVPPSHAQTLDEGLIGWAAHHGETVLVNDVTADQRYLNRYAERLHTRAELCVPIRVGAKVLGVLDVQSDYRDAFDDSDVRVLETLAGQIAGAMENARLYEAERDAHQQVRHLATYLQNAREEERAHISRQILDEFGQLMTALQMDLSWLVNRLPDEQPQLTEKAETMSGVIDDSLQVIGTLSSQLRPRVLDHFGLAAAIKWQARAFSEGSDIPHRLRLDDEADSLAPELSTALFRILQESLRNVERHAEASEVRIDLQVDTNQAAVVVVDDGRGIAPEEISGPGSLGLAGMRQRAEALGGRLTVEGLPGQGTTVTASIPRMRRSAQA